MPLSTLDVRSLIINCPLREQAVKIDGWDNANLVIRELSAKAGSELMTAVTTDGKVDQESLIAGIVIDTLRNADDEKKALVFGYDDRDEGNPAFKDALMSTGLGRIMEVANASIELSGLKESAAVDAAKNA